MNRPVKVGNVQTMGGGVMPMDSAPQPPVEEDTFWDRFKAAFVPAFQAQQLGMGGGQGFAGPNILTPDRATGFEQMAPSRGTPIPRTPLFPNGGVLAAGLSMGMDTGRPPFASAGGRYVPSREEYAASLGIGGRGGGAARPDFSAYRAALTGQAQQLNAQIQAMYNALGEEAGANMGRIQDIYGGASTGIGDVYGSAISNVGDAYGSAQQQAADQLARLGIEQAAPAVINPMALSQAEAVSQLEQGQAGGLAATERFGSAASGFGSQMAQVAQQQGTEMNAAILASLQNRLAESLAAEQSGGGGGGGGGGMSVSDMLKLREAYNEDVLGNLPIEERRFAFEQAQAIIRNARSDEEAFLKLVTPDRNTGKPLLSTDEAEDAIRYARETFAPNFMPGF